MGMGRIIRAVLVLLLAWSAAPAAAAPVTCRIGAYITALHDVDTVKGTFAAEAWLWTLCPGRTVQPLTSVEAANANESAMSLHSLTPRPGAIWEQQKLTGTFRHGYDLQLFPFDRHRLTIELEEGTLDTGGLRYVFDAANSGISPSVRVDGWQVTGFAGRVSERGYPTNFGDPSLRPGSRAAYAHLDLSIGLARHNWSGFFKLAVPVYVAAMLALLSLLLFGQEGHNVINARIGLLAGLLFAVVLNLRSTDDVIGATPSLTLMDLVHFAALALILAATLAALATGRRLDRGGAVAAIKARDRQLFWWAGGVYVAVNVVLVLGALLLR
jgi:hypothetical protein